MKLFDSEYFQRLISQPKNNPRGRQHCNIHHSDDEPCQRLFNVIEPRSYIRPHRHTTDPREELLIAIRGKMVLLTFNDSGKVARMAPLVASEINYSTYVGVKVSCDVWHTVIALESGSILLEIKAGPFDPSQPKDLAPKALEEGTIPAKDYPATPFVMFTEKIFYILGIGKIESHLEEFQSFKVNSLKNLELSKSV